jgi:hypothetical protein
VYRQGCAVVFVLDTNSLRHLFKHAGFPDEADPVAAANVSHSARARQHGLRARERGVGGRPSTRLSENVWT